MGARSSSTHRCSLSSKLLSRPLSFAVLLSGPAGSLATLLSSWTGRSSTMHVSPNQCYRRAPVRLVGRPNQGALGPTCYKILPLETKRLTHDSRACSVESPYLAERRTAPETPAAPPFLPNLLQPSHGDAAVLRHTPLVCSFGRSRVAILRANSRAMIQACWRKIAVLEL